MAAVGSLKCYVIGGRTDSAGVAQADWDQEEVRLPLGILLRPGITANLTTGVPNLNAFRVRQDTGANLAVKVGSGTTKVDGIVLRGGTAGQGTYILRLDAATLTTNTTTTDATNPTRYGVYAFIDDAAYAGDASRQYAGITLLKGTPAASPVTPAASAVWSASALLWEFQLPALATAITDAILDSASSFDRRVTANLQAQNVLESRVFS
jgi:hypothetical protein